MIEHLPQWLNILFIFTTIYIIAFFHIANGRPTKVTLVIILAGIVHSLLAYIGFYENMYELTPRFALVILSVVVFFIYGFRKQSIAWLGPRRNQLWSTLSHSVRIPVEICLLYLFMHDMVPELMTFEGRNFDILAGLTAPLITWLLYKKKISDKGLIFWNVLSLCLVSFILLNGLLSAELPFQQFAFDQPNKAVAYFPYILLPAIIVPIVIYTHVTDIILLSQKPHYTDI